MNRPDSAIAGAAPAAAVGLLLLAAAFVLLIARDRAEARDELRIERNHRVELAGRLRVREDQLDGALAHIKKMNGDGGELEEDGGAEPE